MGSIASAQAAMGYRVNGTAPRHCSLCRNSKYTRDGRICIPGGFYVAAFATCNAFAAHDTPPPATTPETPDGRIVIGPLDV